MAVTPTVETAEVIANYKLYAEAMFADDAPYAKAKQELKDDFEGFGLVNAEYGQVLAQTLAGMATQVNSEALKAGQTTMTLAKDVALKQAQTDLVTRQTRGYDDNQLLKVVEHYSGIAQFAVNAGNADNIQSTIAILNTKIGQVESRVDDGTYIPEPLPDEILDKVDTVTFTSVTATTFRASWTTITGATSYIAYIDGVSQGSTNLGYIDFTGGTASTKYSVEVVAYSGAVEGKHALAKIVTTTA